MKLVIIESPFAGLTEADMLENIAYAKRAVMDCLRRGEAPIAQRLAGPLYGRMVTVHRAKQLITGKANPDA